MRTGKVISLAVSGKGNKVYQADDLVNENKFAPGKFDQLVKEGHIQENLVEVATTEEEKLPPPSDDEKKGGSSEDDDHESKNKIETMDDISIDQLKKDLNDAEIGFNKKADKATLYDLWLTLKK